MTDVKICGLSDPENLAVAIEAGTRFVGFVFYPPSPRNVSFDTAFHLARAVPTGVRSIGLFVNPKDEQLERTLTGIQLDMVQLHGDEPPQRINEIKERFSMPVMKAIRIRDENDLKDVEEYEAAADWLLFDARPENASLPGGTGESFDWNILKAHIQKREFKKPWMLSGGLNADNVKEALSILKPNAVDISSGVESTKGVKDAEKIKSFIKAVKTSD